MIYSYAYIADGCRNFVLVFVFNYFLKKFISYGKKLYIPHVIIEYD